MSEEYNRFDLGSDPEKKTEVTETTEQKIQNPVENQKKKNLQNRKHSSQKTPLMHFLTEKQASLRRRTKNLNPLQGLIQRHRKKIHKILIKKINIRKVRIRKLLISLINFLPRFLRSQ